MLDDMTSARDTKAPIDPTAALRDELRLGPVITAPGCARAWARAVLAAWKLDVQTENAELIVSELVTNALRASTDTDGHALYQGRGKPVIHVRMLAGGERLVIEVWDTIPEAPAAKCAGPDDEGGRGLQLVETISDKWDWTTAEGWPGKCVWAELS